MLLILSLFLAIGAHSASLSCDGEAVTVPGDTTQYAGTPFVAVVCDSIGPWPSEAWCVANECSATREEAE